MKETLPIFIVSYNRLVYMQSLLKWLNDAGYKRIIIVDNSSTYPPLITFLQNCPYKVEFLEENWGHLAVWKCGRFDHILRSEYYVVTDCDIVPESTCPADVIEYFYSLLRHFPQLTKVGFSLRIDDLPECFVNRETVIEWEKKFWRKKFPNTTLFKAAIDTTFALYRPGIFPDNRKWWASGRADYPYIAQHMPWYEDSSNLSEETLYYQSIIKAGSSHWLTNAQDLRKENVQLRHELEVLKADMAFMSMTWHASLIFILRFAWKMLKNAIDARRYK